MAQILIRILQRIVLKVVINANNSPDSFENNDINFFKLILIQGDYVIRVNYIKKVIYLNLTLTKA